MCSGPVTTCCVSLWYLNNTKGSLQPWLIEGLDLKFSIEKLEKRLTSVVSGNSTSTWEIALRRPCHQTSWRQCVLSFIGWNFNFEISLWMILILFALNYRCRKWILFEAFEAVPWENNIRRSETVPRRMFQKPVATSAIVDENHRNDGESKQGR